MTGEMDSCDFKSKTFWSAERILLLSESKSTLRPSVTHFLSLAAGRYSKQENKHKLQKGGDQGAGIGVHWPRNDKCAKWRHRGLGEGVCVCVREREREKDSIIPNSWTPDYEKIIKAPTQIKQMESWGSFWEPPPFPLGDRDVMGIISLFCPWQSQVKVEQQHQTLWMVGLSRWHDLWPLKVASFPPLPVTLTP